MEVSYQPLTRFLSSEQHLNVPIYQRKYSWEYKHCKKLFNDVVDIGKSDKENHFLGSIVFQLYRKEIDELYIIDGQQRITSMSLLILAIAKYLKNNPEICAKYDISDRKHDDLVKRYLINPILTENENKLILTEEDNNSYKKIIDSVRFDTKIEKYENDSERIYNNYRYLYNLINEENIKCVLKGTDKLSVVTLNLKNTNAPQEIFESMNSTGKDLRISDLIRNFLLMDLKPSTQNRIYFKHWKNIEQIFEKNNLSFDDFIHNYLVMKLSRAVKKSEVYENFKNFANKNYENVECLVLDIKKYVGYFSKIMLGKEEDKKLNNALQSLSKLNYGVIHPFLFRLYDDYTDPDEKLTAGEFVKIVEYTESYAFRRYILGLNTNVLRYVFKDMYDKLDKENYLESYKYHLNTLVENNYNYRMPTDDEFIEELGRINVLDLKRNTKYWFEKMEGYNTKAPVNVYSKDYQIEHIMPQTLTRKWKEDLGKEWKRIHKDYLHTIGNVTLIEYNAELSNNTYDIKKTKADRGYIYSSVKMNNYFINVDKWDEEEILKRKDYLCNIALKVWEFPEITDEVIEKYKPKKEEKPIEVDDSEFNEIEKLRFEYWKEFYYYLNENDDLFVYPTPNKDNWYSLFFKNGIAHIELTISVAFKNTVNAHFRIKKNSNEIFDELYSQKEDIESEIGMELEWDKAEDKKISKIGKTLDIDVNDEENWKIAIEWQYDMAVKLYDVFSKRIAEFK